MQIELEDLEYQRRAVATVVRVLDGQVKNTFDNSNLFGIQANVTNLTPGQIEENKKNIIAENGIAEADAKLTPDPDVHRDGDRHGARRSCISAPLMNSTSTTG